LASSAQHGFTYTASATAGSIDIAYGNDPASKVTINVAANATANDVATAINANETSPVYAAVIKDASNNERIVFSSRKTGDNSDFTVDTTAMGAGSSLVEDSTYARTSGLNASYSLDGAAPVSSETNTISNAIPGVTLTLKGVTSSSVSVS